MHVVRLRPNLAKDPSGDAFRASVECALGLRAGRAIRTRFVGVLAALSIPLWISAEWPHLLGAGIRAIMGPIWLIAAAAVAIGLGVEWRCARKLQSLESRLGGAAVRDRT